MRLMFYTWNTFINVVPPPPPKNEGMRKTHNEHKKISKPPATKSNFAGFFF